MRVLNFGSLNIDKTYSVRNIVKAGETINSLSYEEFIGGKGLNQSIALANAGADVWHAGLVGQADGGPLIQRLKDSGVNTDLVEKRDKPSGHALIQVDEKGMNSIIVDGGTNRMVDRPYVDKVLSNFGPGDLLLIQNEISELAYIVDSAYEKSMTICLNPSPYDDMLDEIDLSKITYFLVNEIEARAISKTGEEEGALEHILKTYPGSKVVMTLGSRGAIYDDGFTSYRVDGNKIEVVDTTAAGDTFCGFFLASISKSMPIQDSMDLANYAASITCTKKGASNSIPLLDQIKASQSKN